MDRRTLRMAASCWRASSSLGPSPDSPCTSESNTSSFSGLSCMQYTLKRAASARAAVAALNPGVEVRAIARRANEELLRELAGDADVVLDCSDNFATRHMLNRVCVALRKPLISGAASGFAGQVSVYYLRRSDSPCYACVFPPSQPAPDARCATTGVLAPLVGMTGSLQAAEAIKLLCGYGTPLTGRLLMADLRRTEFTQVHLHRRTDCEVCGA